MFNCALHSCYMFFLVVIKFNFLSFFLMHNILLRRTTSIVARFSLLRKIRRFLLFSHGKTLALSLSVHQIIDWFGKATGGSIASPIFKSIPFPLMTLWLRQATYANWIGLNLTWSVNNNVLGFAFPSSVDCCYSVSLTLVSTEYTYLRIHSLLPSPISLLSCVLIEVNEKHLMLHHTRTQSMWWGAKIAEIRI